MLLTVIFYYHNQKITSSTHSSNKRIRPPVPVEAGQHPGEKHNFIGADETKDCLHLKVTENTDKFTLPSKVPLNRGKIGDGNPFVVMADRIEDVCNVAVAESILDTATKIQEMIHNIDNKNKNRSFNSLDLIYFSYFGNVLALKGDVIFDDPTINSHVQILE